MGQVLIILTMSYFYCLAPVLGVFQQSPAFAQRVGVNKIFKYVIIFKHEKHGQNYADFYCYYS